MPRALNMIMQRDERYAYELHDGGPAERENDRAGALPGGKLETSTERSVMNVELLDGVSQHATCI